MYQKVVVVESEIALRTKRLRQRGLTNAEIEKQSDHKQLIEKGQIADYVISNNGSMKDLQSQIKELWEIETWRLNVTND